MFAATPGTTLVLNGQGHILIANRSAERTFGRSQVELLGTSLLGLLVPECRLSLRLDDVLAAQATWRATGEPLVCRNLFGIDHNTAGAPFPLELSFGAIDARPDQSMNAPVAVVVVRDVTEQERVERRHATAAAEAREARQRLEALLEFAPAFIIAISRRGTIDFINRTLPQHDKKDVIGSSWLRYFPPERQAVMQASMQRMYDTESTQTFETATPGPDGVPVWFESQIAPIRAGGQIAGAVMVSQDITERKRAQAELLAGRHLALLGTLAAGVAHEINTPIQFVGNSIQFLSDAARDLLTLVDRLQLARQSAREGGSLDEALQAAARAEEDLDLTFLRQNMPPAFDRCSEGLNRVATIVRSLKEFAHPIENVMKAVDLNHTIGSALTIATNEYKYVAALETDLGELPPIVCNGGEVSQAVLNIVVNAAHAIGDVVKGTDRRGIIRVRTWQEGDEVVISISDTGGGIPEPIRGRVFDPFFTTKEVGKGTGQGLAIAWVTVNEHHGGALSFESEEGKGTTFFIRLPIAGKEPNGDVSGRVRL